jgi:peptidoglycan/LPS O-acetylase OafA/YrhL
VEEQFYLFWPLIILLLRKPGRLLIFALLILLLTGVARYVVWSYKVEDLAYSSLYTFTRIDGLSIGAMVALLLRINRNFLKKYTIVIVLLMAAVNFGFYFLNNREGFTLPYLAFVGYTTFAVLFGLLVHEAVNGDSKIIRFILDNRPLKFFGKISYGLYVYHWPVYILFFDYLKNLVIEKNLVSFRIAEMISAVAVTLIAILVSVASYHYFEKPFLKLKNRFS